MQGCRAQHQLYHNIPIPGRVNGQALFLVEGLAKVQGACQRRIVQDPPKAESSIPSHQRVKMEPAPKYAFEKLADTPEISSLLPGEECRACATNKPKGLQIRAPRDFLSKIFQ